MRNFLITLAAVTTVFAQNVQTGFNITGAPGVYSINTADNYSWQTRTEVFTFQHTNVEEITHILKECLSKYGKIQINDQMNMVVITDEAHKLQNILTLCKNLDVEDMKEFVKLKTETVNLNYTVPSKIKGYLESYLSIDGELQAYDDLNILIIHDHDDVIERISKEITKFDISPQEIRINFDIVEVINSDFKDNGVNWDELFSVVNANAGWTFRRGNSEDDQSQTSSTSPDFIPNTGKSKSERNSGNFDFNGGATISTHNFKNFLRFMVEDGSANYVSNNSLSVLNNHSSVFYYNYQGSSVRVDIRPNLLNEETVKMKILLSIDSNVIYETTIHSKLGAVKKLVSFQNVRSTTNNKTVPGLGTILPYLFSRKERGKNEVQLDLVVTATL